MWTSRIIRQIKGHVSGTWLSQMHNCSKLTRHPIPYSTLRQEQRSQILPNIESDMSELPRGCITLEEHAAFPSLGDDHSSYDEIWNTFPSVRERLRDFGQGRLREMDDGHINFQILSQVTGIANLKDPESSRAANNELADVIRKQPSRFGGFAALCMTHPREASLELERAVTQLGLCGAMVDNHLPDMTHYDAERFWPVFEMAERLDVPIYFHPASASDKVVAERFRGNYGEVVTTALATGAWGWHENEGLHVLKLYGAGLFTRFPNLKIIIGHMGELIPMMVDRVSDMEFFRRTGLASFRDVWEKNIWVTTSGIFTVRTLEMLLKVTPLDHVLYSIDTPFCDNKTGWRFVEDIARSGMMSTAELEQFVSGNAKKLFKL